MVQFTTEQTGSPIGHAGFSIAVPALSKWKCEVFGSGNDIVWRPREGHEPNWFWRKMQYLAFGNRWVKDR